MNDEKLYFSGMMWFILSGFVGIDTVFTYSGNNKSIEMMAAQFFIALLSVGFFYVGWSFFKKLHKKPMPNQILLFIHSKNGIIKREWIRKTHENEYCAEYTDTEGRIFQVNI